MKNYIVGLDEVGTGSAAGPVFAAAVILDSHNVPEGLADSKKLREAERERLAELIWRDSIAAAVGSASVEEVDSINVLNASHLAMLRALLRVMSDVDPSDISLLIVDGNKTPRELFDVVPALKVQTLVKADALVPEVSAASIIAKVARDALLSYYDTIHPQYGFAKHKGYMTLEHMRAISEFGLSPIHRLSFKLKATSH